MRVQAELRRDPTPLLEALAKELADCRGDPRRIVSGLTPSAVHDGDRVSDLVGKLGVASREDAIDVARASGIGPRR